MLIILKWTITMKPSDMRDMHAMYESITTRSSNYKITHDQSESFHKTNEKNKQTNTSFFSPENHVLKYNCECLCAIHLAHNCHNCTLSAYISQGLF